MIFPVLHLHITESKKDISEAGALVILHSNPPNGNVTTPLKFFPSLFWCCIWEAENSSLFEK